MIQGRGRWPAVVGWAGILALLAALAAPPAAAAERPIEIRVVIVATWEVERAGQDIRGELHAWRTQWPLRTQMEFPLGTHPLLYDADRHVLAIVTGMATARAAASIMALGADPRFDLSHAYWIVAGTAGVDPKAASAGSTAWARYVVDGDLAQELDARDMPADWPIGVVPYGRIRPYESPAPAGQGVTANVAYELNPGLTHWAFGLTRDLALPDDPTLARLRAPYQGPAARPPFVLEGDGLMSARTWYGPRLNQWAEDWVAYWTAGRGQFAMSAEEDSGILQALTMLAPSGRVDLKRVLVLRSASDYTVGPPDLTAAEFLAKEAREGFPANAEALENLYRVAAPVARTLADDWVHTRQTIPGAQSAFR